MNVTAKEAYKKLIGRYSAISVARCYEYDSMFVFEMRPAMMRLYKNARPMIDALVSVNKATNEIRDFKPFYISSDEYKRGKEVPESEYKRW